MERRSDRRPFRALTFVVGFGVAMAPVICVAQADADAGYPRGAESIPLLHEIWESAAENIYPTELAERFGPITLTRLESELGSDREPAVADVVNPFLDGLGVSHTRFYDRRHQSFYMLRSLFSTRDLDEPELYTIGVQLDERDPGLVRAVMEGSPAAEAGLRRADRIVAVDGSPFDSLLQWQRPEAVTLTIERELGVRDVALDPVLQGYHRGLLDATIASRRIVECGDRRIGYFHLWSGTNDAFLESLRDFVADARRMSLDGLVLDLRDGYGGAWYRYLDPFFESRIDYFTYTTVNSQGVGEPAGSDPQFNFNAWSGPLAVIINAGTRSGKEALAFQFKKSGRAVIFGTNTAGAFTGGRGVFADRPADYILYLSVEETLLDGKPIEGVGVQPDVVVPDSPERDAPLAAALEHLACPSAL